MAKRSAYHPTLRLAQTHQPEDRHLHFPPDRRKHELLGFAIDVGNCGFAGSVDHCLASNLQGEYGTVLFPDSGAKLSRLNWLAACTHTY